MTLDQSKFAAVVETAKAKAANDPKWLRAIEKAAAGILDGSLIVTVLAHGAVVTGRNGSHHANGACDCEAARRGHTQCYHRAAARLMDIYETAPEAVSLDADVAASSREDLIAEIENIWLRFAPGLPIGVELLARFGKSKLQMLDMDMLRRVRLAIAL
jgi:hypothetical protein